MQGYAHDTMLESYVLEVHKPHGLSSLAERHEHIALQHGVVGIALHLDAVVGKHMAVVFDVLTQLGTGVRPSSCRWPMCWPN